MICDNGLHRAIRRETHDRDRSTSTLVGDGTGAWYGVGIRGGRFLRRSPSTLVNLDTPPVRFVNSHGALIAYQVVGAGRYDLIIESGFLTQLEMLWECPPVARFLRSLSRFARVILYDVRGTGLSDRGVERYGFTEDLDDIDAILDAVGSQRCFHFGWHIGGRRALMYGATHPDRTAGVVTLGAHPTTFRDDDYPWGAPRAELDQLVGIADRGWIDEAAMIPLTMLAHSVSDDPFIRAWWARLARAAASRRETATNLRAQATVDIRPLLAAVRVPVLLLHRADDRSAHVDVSRYMADRIPDARLVELPGTDCVPYFEDPERILHEIEQFMTGSRTVAEPNRVLSTVLFADIVGSTERAAETGDARWRELIDLHDTIVREQIAAHGGRYVKNTGDGFLARFDGPARAIRCAAAIRDSLRRLGIDVRQGVHTGEIELRGDDIGGITVHIGARVSTYAKPGEVVVSRTVVDVVAGSMIEFEDRGVHVLKGVPGSWQIYAAGV